MDEGYTSIRTAQLLREADERDRIDEQFSVNPYDGFSAAYVKAYRELRAERGAA